MSHQEIFDLSEAIDNLNKLTGEILKNLVNYENINSDKIRKPSLRNIIENKITISDYPERRVLNFIEYFERLKNDNLKKIFINTEIIGVAVFFMPGTEDPIPFFYGDWPKNLAQVNDKGFKDYPEYVSDNILLKTKDISKDLRWLSYPINSKISFNPTNHTNLRFNHFFFWIKALYDLSYIYNYGFTPEYDNIELDTNFYYKGFIKRFNVTNDDGVLEKPKINLVNGGHNIIIEWNTQGNHPGMVISPIHLNHDAFVLVTTFLPDDYYNRIYQDRDILTEITTFHNLLSFSIFDFIYNAILREENQEIFNSLKRKLVSQELLLKCSLYLRENNFTYEWKTAHNNVRYCSDIRAHLIGDIKEKPDDIFNLLLGLENNIYKTLREKIETYRSSNPIKYLLENGKDKYILPLVLSNSEILKDLELTQRGLKMMKRDHVVHQFQVFLLGTIFIQKYYNEFILAFCNSLNIETDTSCQFQVFIKDLINSTDYISTITNRTNDKTQIIELLMKFCWLVSALNHDVGYPIQEIDSTMDKLQEGVAELPEMIKKFHTTIPKLNYSPILYDDPRTYILLKYLSYNIADNFSGITAVSERESERNKWWYLIRYLTFHEKRHELMSVVIVGLNFLKGQTLSIEEFLKSSYGNFIMNNILIPVSLHHIKDWNTDMNKHKASYDASTDLKHKTDVIHHYLPDLDNFKIDFNKSPIAALLIYCDSIQETGRPSASKEDVWPYNSEDEFLKSSDTNFDEVYKLTHFYRHEQKFQEDKCTKHFKDQKDKLESIFQDFVKLGPLEKTKIILNGNYKNQSGNPVEFTPKEVKYHS